MRKFMKCVKFKWNELLSSFFAQKKITTKTTRNDKKTAISHRREKVNIDNFTGQYWAITGRILRHFWSDMTHLCLAITALIFDNCYNGITLTFLDLNDSCNELYLLILEQFQDGRRTHKDEKKKKTWYEEPGRNSKKLRIVEFSNLALRNGDYILETFLTIFLEKDSFATSFSLKCTLISAQHGWTNGGKTFSTHQHQDGSRTGMLNEIMKDLWKKFALSSRSISETKIIFV